MRKAVLVGLAASIFACGLPRDSWADGGQETPSEEADYARRELAAPELQDFRGGHGPDGVVLVIGIILLPVWLPIFGLVKLGEWLIDLCTPEPPPKPTEEPEKPCGESMSHRKLLPANG